MTLGVWSYGKRERLGLGVTGMEISLTETGSGCGGWWCLFLVAMQRV